LRIIGRFTAGYFRLRGAGAAGELLLFAGMAAAFVVLFGLA